MSAFSQLLHKRLCSSRTISRFHAGKVSHYWHQNLQEELKHLDIWSPVVEQELNNLNPWKSDQPGLSQRKLACHDMATVILNQIIDPTPTLQQETTFNRYRSTDDINDLKKFFLSLNSILFNKPTTEHQFIVFEMNNNNQAAKGGCVHSFLLEQSNDMFVVYQCATNLYNLCHWLSNEQNVGWNSPKFMAHNWTWGNFWRYAHSNYGRSKRLSKEDMKGFMDIVEDGCKGMSESLNQMLSKSYPEIRFKDNFNASLGLEVDDLLRPLLGDVQDPIEAFMKANKDHISAENMATIDTKMYQLGSSRKLGYLFGFAPDPMIDTLTFQIWS